MAKLPQEVMVHILSRLPLKPLGRFRCVCRSWRTLLTDPYFIKMHLNRATQNDNLSLLLSSDDLLFSVNCKPYNLAISLDSPSSIISVPTISVVGSCNGLLCLSDGKGRASLYNPTTREFVKLPHTPGRFSFLDFCYVPATEEYKVVRIVNKSRECEMKVHTVGTKSWRRIVDVPPHIRQCMANALFNGAIHWRASREGMGFQFIISFDIGDEKFREFLWPNCCEGNHINFSTLKAFGGCLSIICHLNNGDAEAWAMKDYGVNGSWSRVFYFKGLELVGDLGWPIPSCKLLEPLHIWKNGKILVLVCRRRLVIYDPSNKMVRDLCIHDIPFSYLTYIYVESLTSIASLMAGNGVEGETQQMKWKPKRRRIIRRGG